MAQLMEKQLIEQPVEMTAPVQVVPRRQRWMFPVVAVVALMLGGLGGWLLAGATDDDTKPTAVVAGNVALTDRQQEMVRITDEYIKAWQANDADALLAFYTPYGKYEIIVDQMYTFRVADGTLKAMFEDDTDDYSDLKALGPYLVINNQVIAVLQRSVGPEFISVLGFTQLTDSAPLIMTHMLIAPW